MFDYHQRAATDDYRDNWERIWGKPVYLRGDGSLHSDPKEFVSHIEQMMAMGVQPGQHSMEAYSAAKRLMRAAV